MSYASKAFTVTALGLVLGCSAPVFANQHYKNTKPRVIKSRKSASKVRQKKVDDVKVEITSVNPTRLPRLLREYLAGLTTDVPLYEFYRHYVLANRIPGYTTRAISFRDKSNKLHFMFATVKKKAGGSVSFNDYKVGSGRSQQTVGLSGNVNDLIDADSFSVFAVTPVRQLFRKSYSLGGVYHKVLDRSGLSMELKYSYAQAQTGFVNDPPSTFTNAGGTFTRTFAFRSLSEGSSTTGVLIYPWVVRPDEMISSQFSASYTDGTNEILARPGQDLASNSKVRLKLPSASFSTILNRRYSRGDITIQGLLTKGGSPFPGAERNTSTNAETNTTKSFRPVNLNFLVMDVGVGGTFSFSPKFAALASLRGQWNPDGRNLPAGFKLSADTGGYVQQTLLGDEGFIGKVGISYLVPLDSRTFRALQASLFTNRGSLWNVDDGLGYRRANVGDVGLGVHMDLSPIGMEVGLQVVKAYTGPVSDKGYRVVLSANAKF